MLKAYAVRALIASTSRKSTASVVTVNFCQVAPPSAVRNTVLPEPLAHATRSLTAQFFRSRGARLLTYHGPFHPILLDGFLQTLLRTLIHEKSIQDHATRTALDELVTSASFEILCVLGVSAVRVFVSIFTAETQRSPRLRREKRIRTLPTDWVM